MLVIKLRGIGKKHQRHFRVIVNEKGTKLSGKFLEDLGWYNPHNKQVSLNKERILYWLKNGAQKSSTIHNLLISQNIIEGKKIPVHKTKKATASATAA